MIDRALCSELNKCFRILTTKLKCQVCTGGWCVSHKAGSGSFCCWVWGGVKRELRYNSWSQSYPGQLASGPSTYCKMSSWSHKWCVQRYLPGAESGAPPPSDTSQQKIEHKKQASLGWPLFGIYVRCKIPLHLSTIFALLLTSPPTIIRNDLTIQLS